MLKNIIPRLKMIVYILNGKLKTVQTIFVSPQPLYNAEVLHLAENSTHASGLAFVDQFQDRSKTCIGT